MKQDNNKYHAVFYDAGMTLIEPYPSMTEVCLSVGKSFGLDIGADRIDVGLRQAQANFMQTFYADCASFTSEAATKNLWAEFYAFALEKAGVTEDRESLLSWGTEVYRRYDHHQYWRPFPEVIETLRELRSRGYLQGVISDWGISLTRILHELYLTPYLDFVIASANVGVAKPDSNVFSLALNRAGVRPEVALHVGDNYWADVIGARCMGITPVLVDRGGSANGVDCLVIRGLDQLLNLL